MGPIENGIFERFRNELKDVAPELRQLELGRKIAALPPEINTPQLRNFLSGILPASAGKRPQAALSIDSRKMLDRYAAMSDADFQKLSARERMLFADLGGVRETVKAITKADAGAALEAEIARLSAERREADAEADAGRGDYRKGSELYARELAATKQLRELMTDLPKPDAE